MLTTAPAELVLAFHDAGLPHWPLVCQRVLHGDDSVPVMFVVFDVLRIDATT